MGRVHEQSGRGNGRLCHTMDKAEQRDPDEPAGAGDPSAIQSMFARIAPRYDLNNRLHSLGRDQAWRRQAVRVSGVRPGESVLDVACGTCDLAAIFAAAGAGRVVGADFCQEMLDLARRKYTAGQAEARIEFLQADAHELPFADATFDIVSIAFGLRNLADPPRALQEFHRVIKAGGRLIVLEFCPDGQGIAKAFIRWFTRVIMPRTAGAIAGDAGAYRYLHNSVQSFLRADQVAAAIRQAGFANVQTRTMTFSTVAIHRGEKPNDGH